VEKHVHGDPSNHSRRNAEAGDFFEETGRAKNKEGHPGKGRHWRSVGGQKGFQERESGSWKTMRKALDERETVKLKQEKRDTVVEKKTNGPFMGEGLRDAARSRRSLHLSGT